MKFVVVTLSFFLILTLAQAEQPQRHAKTVISSYFKFDPAQPVRVAVLPFLKSNGDPDLTLAEITSAELMRAGFRVVDRDRVEEALKEMKLTLTGVIASKDFKSLGKWLAADLIVTGSENEARGAIALKMTNVETGEVMISSFLDASTMQFTDAPAAIVASIHRTMMNTPDPEDLSVPAVSNELLRDILGRLQKKTPIVVHFKDGTTFELLYMSRQTTDRFFVKNINGTFLSTRVLDIDEIASMQPLPVAEK